jgi:hypothetical protein
MPIGSMPSLSTAPGTSSTLSKNFSNHSSRFMPFHKHQVGALRLDDVLRRGLVTVDLAPGLVMDSTIAASPATSRAMSAMMVKLVTTFFLPESSALRSPPQPMANSAMKPAASGNAARRVNE